MATELPPRLAVDGDGFCWRVWSKGTHDLPEDMQVLWPDGSLWSMARVNPDNSPVPEPITFYEPRSAVWAEACEAVADGIKAQLGCRKCPKLPCEIHEALKVAADFARSLRGAALARETGEQQ